MKNLYLINEIYSDQKLNSKNNEIDLKFDFPEWLSKEIEPLENFKKNVTYKFLVDLKKLIILKKKLAL